MNWVQEHSLILSLLLLYIGFMIYSAWSGVKKTKTATDYFVGGRSLGGVALGLSFFATYASTNTYLGFSGRAYELGLAWLLIIPFAIFLSALSWVAVAPRLRDLTESLDSITIPDFIGYRYNSSRARIISAIIVIFSSFLYMTAVFKGIGNLLEIFLDIPYVVAIFMVLIIVMVYTSIGGFYSVVKTDSLQGVLMIFAAILLFVGITDAAGGIGAISNLKYTPQGPELLTWNTVEPLSIVIGIVFATTIKFLVDPRQLSRFFALKNHKERVKGIFVSTFCFIVAFCLLVPIGLYAHLVPIGPIADTDTVIPTLMDTPGIFSTWTAAFLFLAIISAAMSSLDSVLLVMATTFKRDIVDLIRKSNNERGEINKTRLLVALFAIITALIALDPPGGIVAMTSFSGGLYASCFLPIIILGLYWERGNGKAAVASMATGLFVLLSWKPLTGSISGLHLVHEIFPAIFLSTVSYVIFSIKGDIDCNTKVTEFFKE